MGTTVLHLELRGLHIAAAVELGLVRPGRPAVVYREGRVLDWAGVELAGAATVRAVRRAVPEAECVPVGELGGAEVYRAAWNEVWRMGVAAEPTSRQRGYVDVTGCLPRRGVRAHLAALARRLARLTDAPPVIGLAGSKLVATYASAAAQRAAEREAAQIVAEREAVLFLQRQPVRPMQGLPRETVALLGALGCRRWAQVAEVPEPRLYSIFGRRGVLLHRWAQAIDPRPVLARWPPPSESLARQVEPDEQGLWVECFGPLSETLARRLAARRQATAEVVLALGRRGQWQRWQRTLARPVHEAARLHELALGLLPLDLDPTGVDEVRLTLRRLRDRQAVQLALFEDAAEERRRQLTRALTAIRHRYGLLAIGPLAELDSPRPRLAELIEQADEAAAAALA